MPYTAKLDWRYKETPTENDANRWERGILDAHLDNQSIQNRLKLVEDALFLNIAKNRFEVNFVDLDGLILEEGWYDQENQRIVGVDGDYLTGFGGAFE